MPVYEIRQNKDGTQMSPATSLDGPAIYTHDVDGEPMEIIASFWAPNRSAAVKAEYAIMGWGEPAPYSVSDF